MSTIEEAAAEVRKAIAVYGMAEADVMGVPSVMPEVAVEAAGLLWAAIRALALAAAEQAILIEARGKHPFLCGNIKKDCIGDPPCARHVLRRRIEALGGAA